MQFGIEGDLYEFEKVLTVGEAMFMKDKTGMGIVELEQGLGKGDPYAIAAWMYTLKRRAGEVVQWKDMMSLDINTFRVISDTPAEEGEAKPDPTETPSTNGKTRKAATTSTT